MILLLPRLLPFHPKVPHDVTMLSCRKKKKKVRTLISNMTTLFLLMIAEIKAQADEDRPIPPYDINATKVEDIYKQDALITPSEYAIIPFKALLDKSTKPLEVLPFPGSTYVNEALIAALSISKKDRHRIRLLMYINFLMAFRTIPDKRLNDTETVSRIMGDTPSLILENFYERFTECPEGSDKKRCVTHTAPPHPLAIS